MALAILERIKALKAEKRSFKERPVAISDYISLDRIAFLNASSQVQALKTLVDLLEEREKLSDREAFHEAILQRERIVSTGIGMGVAIPHAKLESFDDFFIAIGIQKGAGIAWDALDGEDVHLIFMIGGPSKKQSEYLHILSRLTAFIKDEERRVKLMNSPDAASIMKLFEGC